MKRWLAAVAASIALVALWALPPSVFEMPSVRASPERLRYEALRRELAREHAALRILRWADSLSTLLHAEGEDGVAVTPPWAEGLDAERVNGWVEAQREALALLARRDPDMRVGVFWVPMLSSAVAGLPLGSSTDEVTLVGERDGVPYCIKAIPYTSRSADMSLRPFSQVGACGLFAAYGMPGEPIQAWLEASTLGFARIAVPTHAANFARVAPKPPESLFGLFGLSRPWVNGENLTVQACLAGRATACERAMTEPELLAPDEGDVAWLVAHTPAARLAILAPHQPFGYLDDALLYEWEDRYGSEAFARFWTSDASVPEAFEAAFGVPLGEWIRDWAAEHVGLYRAGPSLPWRSVWLSVLTLAALAAGASLASVRRRVGSG